MAIGDFTSRFIFLFIPGILTTTIVDRLTENKRTYGIEFLIFSMLYGILSYMTLYFLYISANFLFKSNLTLTFFECLFDESIAISMHETWWASVISIIVAFPFSFIINRGFMYMFCRKFKISDLNGGIDVWANLFKSKQIQWITVKDEASGWVYQGFLTQYSQNHQNAELYLSEVNVKNSEKNIEYSLDGIYLSFDSNNINLQFQRIPSMNEVEHSKTGEYNKLEMEDSQYGK